MDYSIFSANQSYSVRLYAEEEHNFRSKFERDRDRILYSKAFRRLSGKTQVFVTSFDDHIRTRLTHTLEVSQIARTIANRLGLNSELTEAIALGHDIGHTPFGHVGERTLNYIMNGCYKLKDFNSDLNDEEKGFKHNWQSLRVLSETEKLKKDFNGLNLTDFTLWGILNHSNKGYKKCKYFYNNNCNLKGIECKGKLSVNFYSRYEEKYLNSNSWTIEGLIVKYADEIAQRHHDIEDGIEANLINQEDLIRTLQKIFGEHLKDYENEVRELTESNKDKIYFLPSLSRFLVNFLTNQLIKDITDKLDTLKDRYKIISQEEFYNIKKEINFDSIVSFNEIFEEKDKEFQKYLSERILNSYKAQRMDGKASYIIRKLFKAYVTNPQQLPDKTIRSFYQRYLSPEDYKAYENIIYIEEIGKLRVKLEDDHFGEHTKKYKACLLRTICDYIGGMTDQYALSQFSELYEA